MDDAPCCFWLWTILFLGGCIAEIIISAFISGELEDIKQCDSWTDVDGNDPYNSFTDFFVHDIGLFVTCCIVSLLLIVAKSNNISQPN